jgi:hypothetical protein
MTALQWLLFIALNEDQERNVGAVEHLAAKKVKLFQGKLGHCFAYMVYQLQ